jgi:hypothetical protein
VVLRAAAIATASLHAGRFFWCAMMTGWVVICQS